MQRDSRNARPMGVDFARYGLSIETLAAACGVDSEWAWTARREGSREVARAAWEMTRDDPYNMLSPSEREDMEHQPMRPFINLARFARAAQSYMVTPFGADNRYDVGGQVVVTKCEEVGGPESGPQLSQWLEIEERKVQV